MVGVSFHCESRICIFFFGHIKGIAIIVFIEIKYTKYSLYSSLTEPFFVDYVIIVSVTAASILVCNL